jgi:hypothetical protein
LPFSAELAQFEIAKQFAHAMGYIDRLVRPGYALGGEQRCEHAVAGGLAGGDAFPHRQLAAARSVQRNVGRHRQRDGLGDPTVVEPQHPDGADRAGDSGIEHVVEAVVAHAGSTEQAAADELRGRGFNAVEAQECRRGAYSFAKSVSGWPRTYRCAATRLHGRHWVGSAAPCHERDRSGCDNPCCAAATKPAQKIALI